MISGIKQGFKELFMRRNPRYNGSANDFASSPVGQWTVAETEKLDKKLKTLESRLAHKIEVLEARADETVPKAEHTLEFQAVQRNISDLYQGFLSIFEF